MRGRQQQAAQRQQRQHSGARMAADAAGRARGAVRSTIATRRSTCHYYAIFDLHAFIFSHRQLSITAYATPIRQPSPPVDAFAFIFLRCRCHYADVAPIAAFDTRRHYAGFRLMPFSSSLRFLLASAALFYAAAAISCASAMPPLCQPLRCIIFDAMIFAARR
jgi:hypothetical protein